MKKEIEINHPESAELSFLYGTIITDGEDTKETTSNVCVFADREVDRSPTGSGVTARVAVQFAKGQISKGEKKRFMNGITGSCFQGSVVSEGMCGDFPAVVVEVKGKAFYTGKSTFTVEEDDPFKEGFLMP